MGPDGATGDGTVVVLQDINSGALKLHEAAITNILNIVFPACSHTANGVGGSILCGLRLCPQWVESGRSSTLMLNDMSAARCAKKPPWQLRRHA